MQQKKKIKNKYQKKELTVEEKKSAHLMELVKKSVPSKPKEIKPLFHTILDKETFVCRTFAIPSLPHLSTLGIPLEIQQLILDYAAEYTLDSCDLDWNTFYCHTHKNKMDTCSKCNNCSHYRYYNINRAYTCQPCKKKNKIFNCHKCDTEFQINSKEEEMNFIKKGLKCEQCKTNNKGTNCMDCGYICLRDKGKKIRCSDCCYLAEQKYFHCKKEEFGCNKLYPKKDLHKCYEISFTSEHLYKQKNLLFEFSYRPYRGKIWRWCNKCYYKNTQGKYKCKNCDMVICHMTVLLKNGCCETCYLDSLVSQQNRYKIKK